MQASETDQQRQARYRAYWRANQRLIAVLLVIWAIFAFAHPLVARQLNSLTILTGFPLGYWLSAQGSITVFVILCFAYALIMNKIIDPKYGVADD